MHLPVEQQPDRLAGSAETTDASDSSKKKYAATDLTVHSWLHKYTWAALAGRNEAGHPKLTCSICTAANAANNFATKGGGVCKDASKYTSASPGCRGLLVKL